MKQLQFIFHSVNGFRTYLLYMKRYIGLLFLCSLVSVYLIEIACEVGNLSVCDNVKCVCMCVSR